ncbi:MAG: histidine kinase [Oscillospiraceae bacterium]|nr:histidine kinase [Oscillospiraceae bacterium]
MGKTDNHNRIARYGKTLVCLFFAALILAQFVTIGMCETTVQTLNSSGNRNIAPSVDPLKKSEEFSAVLYNNKNGMPTSEANVIAQTSDGFLWIGSYAGLIRYDGTTFERISSSSGIANVTCLYTDSADRLWVGTNDSGLFLMSKGYLHNWNKQDGLLSLSIRALAEDGNGNMYTSSAAGGLAMIDGSQNLTVLSGERIAGQSIPELRLGSDGLIYGFTAAGDLFTVANGKLVTFLGHDECRIKNISSILPDPGHAGNLYVGTGGSRIYYGNLQRNFTAMNLTDVSPLSTIDSLEAIHGKIWICAGNGIGVLDTTGVHTLKNVPMNNSVGNVMTDYEGNLWFTSSRQGVMKIVPNHFTDLFERYNLPEATVNSTCTYGKQLFIGTDNGLIVIQNEERVPRIPLKRAVTASGENLETDDLLEFLDGVRIRSIIRDSKGRLWISTWRKYGLLCYDGEELIVYTQKDGIFSDQVRAVSECEDGTILVANTGGVNIIQNDVVTGGYGEDSGIRNVEILTVMEGFHHEVIAGSDGDGIYIISPDGTKHIGLEDGLTSEIVMRVKRSRTQDVYWIVTGNSLAYMTTDYRVTTIRQFPYANNYDLYENSKGDVWVLSSTGIFVDSAEHLLANEAINPVFFGIHSGLPYMDTANSYSGLTRDGDLYIAGSSGVIKVNIEKSFANIIDLKISMPYLVADGERIYADRKGTFNIPSSVKKLTIQPFVFNFSLINPLVSYRLDGFDESDTTVSRDELLPIDYTNLKLAAYHFILKVKDPISQSEKTVSYKIVIGRELSSATAGTITMDIASLFLMGGILVYTSSYRKRNRPEDRLFFSMILSNIAMTVGELLSYSVENSTFPFTRELMITGNTVLFISLVLFPFLFFVYIDYLTDLDKVRIQKDKLLFGIPFFLFLAVMILNLKTGWIFSVGEGNIYQPGFLAKQFWLPIIPVLFYLLFSLIKISRADKHLAGLGLLLIASRLVWEIWYPGISSTSFVFTLFIVCTHIYVMNHPIPEEASGI